MPSGMAVEEASSIEVIAAWVAAKLSVGAVAASPGWRVVGEYYLPKSTKARLDVVGSVSASGLTLTARLWNVTAKAPVSGSVSTTSEAPVRLLGGIVSLTGNRRYQIQIECTGGAGDDKFGLLETATITD